VNYERNKKGARFSETQCSIDGLYAYFKMSVALTFY